VSIGLPLMASLGYGKKARADEQAPPKRLVIMFSPNGTVQETWRPTGNETGFTLGPILEPLNPYRNDLIICDGINMDSSNDGPGDGHQRGMGHMLTARTLSTTGDFEGGGGGNPVGYPNGPSIDQVIADAVGRTTKFRSLELGVQVHSANIWTRMCYAAANRPVAPENNPYLVYERLFGDLDVNPADLIRQNRRRATVLDLVKNDYQALLPRLDQFDRNKLEAHLDTIRDIESRLDLSVAGVSDNCVKPDEPGMLTRHDPVILPHLHESNFEAVGQLQMDMLVSALSCDITRVATLQFSQSVSQQRFTHVGVNDHHHDLSHAGDSDVAAQAKLTTINRWYADQMRYLIAKMKAVPEGNGTLLDNTVILWINELGKGNSHTRRNVPIVLAGGCGGFFKTGRYLRFGGVSHSNLLLTLAHAMGLQSMSSFGEPRHSTGPLTRLYT